MRVLVLTALALAGNHYQVGCDCSGLPPFVPRTDAGSDADAGTDDAGTATNDGGTDAGQLGDGGHPPEPRWAEWPRKISESRQDAFPLMGSCRLPGGDIELGGAFSGFTPCQSDGGWRTTASFRAKGQGMVTVSAVQWSPDRSLRSAPVLRSWLKDSAVCDDALNRASRPFAGGMGSMASPFLICTAEQLSGPIGGTDVVRLVNDVTLDGGFVTITGPGAQWSGTFEGNGFTIIGLAVPLIETLSGNGVVSSLRVENANVTGFMGGHSGTIVGTVSAGSRVEDCSVSGVMTGGSDHVGALVGTNYGDIRNCNAQMLVNGGYAAGGLVGHNYAFIVRSWSTGDAYAPAGAAGGFVGRNDGDITDCFSTGAGHTTANMGGGFIGELIQGTVTRCYSTGTASSSDGPGGFIGVNSGTPTVNDGFWNVETSALMTSALGSPLTSADMADAGTYRTWDFSTVWRWDPQRSQFPLLR